MVSNTGAAKNRAADPTSICRPTTIMKFPPDVAPRAARVAKASAKAPMPHSSTPNRSTPALIRLLMIKATPTKPANRPTTPSGRSRSSRNSQPGQCNQQRHGRGYNGSNRGFDSLHCIEIQTQIKGILADSKQDCCAPLSRCQSPALSHRACYRDADKAGNQKSKSQREQG